MKLLQDERQGTDRPSARGRGSVCPAKAHSTLSNGSFSPRTSVPFVKMMKDRLTFNSFNWEVYFIMF